MSQVARRVEDIEEPAPIYDWEHDGYPLHVLWGRVFVLAALLLIAFLIGRAGTAPGVPPEEINALRTELAGAQERIAALERRLEEGRVATTGDSGDAAAADTRESGEGVQKAGAEVTTAVERASDSEDGGGAGGEAAAPDTYIVNSGDSLNLIASRLYGDASFARSIARANGIDRARDIKVGDKLEIPPKP